MSRSWSSWRWQMVCCQSGASLAYMRGPPHRVEENRRRRAQISFAEEVDDRHVKFLRRSKFHMDLHHARLCRWGEILLEGVPCFLGRHGTDDVIYERLSWASMREGHSTVVGRHDHTSKHTLDLGTSAPTTVIDVAICFSGATSDLVSRIVIINSVYEDWRHVVVVEVAPSDTGWGRGGGERRICGG